ncbi:DUF2382 domain-containing protein, partial [Kitasatospora sp. NPDC004272]
PGARGWAEAPDLSKAGEGGASVASGASGAPGPPARPAAPAAPAAFAAAKAAPAPTGQQSRPSTRAEDRTEDRAEGRTEGLAEDRAEGRAAVAPTAPVEITCREERIDISTEWHEVGTTRLRKYVTTEQVERRVPVVRERVRVERIPVSDAERAALSEQEIAEAVEEVTLHEERPVVRKYLAPIERVRLVVERYTEEEVVREELRREQVEVHDATSGAVGDGEAPQQRQPWNAQPQSPAAARAQQAAANGGPEHTRPEPLRS